MSARPAVVREQVAREPLSIQGLAGRYPSMRLFARASLFALAMTLWHGTAHAEADPRGIRVVCDGGARFGAGILVRDFRPGSHGLLLLTALHVVQGCEQIEPMIVGCSAQTTRVLRSPWSATHPVELVVWRSYDLIAVAIPSVEQAAFTAQIEPVGLAENVDDVRPPASQELTLVAKSGVNICPRIPARARDVVTVADLYDGLNLPDYYALFGSLSASATVVSYESTAVEGASGGPVLWIDSKRRALVAVHLGGQPSVVQWGLLVGRKLLNDALRAAGPIALTRLDAGQPAVAVSNFAAPLQLTQPSQELSASADVALHSNALSVQVEGSTPISRLGVGSGSLQLGWTHLWASIGSTAAVGSRLAVGGSAGTYRSPVFLDDARQEGALNGTAKLPFFGGFGELAAELQLTRFSQVYWTLGLGLRLGVSHLPDVANKGTHFTWGPVSYARAHWRWSDRLSGLAQLHLTVVRIPADKTPLGCEGPSVPGPETWDVWSGLSVGVEVEP